MAVFHSDPKLVTCTVRIHTAGRYVLLCCVNIDSRRIQEAHRTCSIWLGVGDAKEKDFGLFEYSESTAKVSSCEEVVILDT